jgi:hypothetical protein
MSMTMAQNMSMNMEIDREMDMAVSLDMCAWEQWRQVISYLRKKHTHKIPKKRRGKAEADTTLHQSR